MAPELLENAEITDKADVYGFGVLLWMMYTEEQPFAGLPGPAILRRILDQKRPEWPDHAPQALKHLAEKCWAQSQDDRFTSAELFDALCTNYELFPGQDSKIVAEKISYYRTLV
jgi:hypothetical protein